MPDLCALDPPGKAFIHFYPSLLVSVQTVCNNDTHTNTCTFMEEKQQSTIFHYELPLSLTAVDKVKRGPFWAFFLSLDDSQVFINDIIQIIVDAHS